MFVINNLFSIFQYSNNSEDMASNKDSTNTATIDDQPKDLEEATDKLSLHDNTKMETKRETDTETKTAAAAAKAKAQAEDFTPYDFVGVRYGKCRWFNVIRGYGFIAPDDGTDDIFVHHTAVQMDGFRSLKEEEAVEFECILTNRGLEATRVSGIAGAVCIGSSYRPHIKKYHRRIRCYNCDKFDHISDNCLLAPIPKTCYFCKKTDHLLADCPLELTISDDPNNSTDKSTKAVEPTTEADAGEAAESTMAVNPPSTGVDDGETVEPNNSS